MLRDLPARNRSRFPFLIVILSPMARYLKPRSFWPFAFAMTGLLVLLYLLEARNWGFWDQAAIVPAVAMFSVLAIVLAPVDGWWTPRK